MRMVINWDKVTELAKEALFCIVGATSDLWVLAMQCKDKEFAGKAIMDSEECTDAYQNLLSELFTDEEIARFMHEGATKALAEMLGLGGKKEEEEKE